MSHLASRAGALCLGTCAVEARLDACVAQLLSHSCSATPPDSGIDGKANAAIGRSRHGASHERAYSSRGCYF